MAWEVCLLSIKLGSEWIDYSTEKHEVVSLHLIEGACYVEVRGEEGYTNTYKEDVFLNLLSPVGSININTVRVDEIGELFIRWLQAERKWKSSIQKLNQDVDFEYENENGYTDKDKPEDRGYLKEVIKDMYGCAKEQQELYDKLYELTDLYIAKTSL